MSQFAVGLADGLEHDLPPSSGVRRRSSGASSRARQAERAGVAPATLNRIVRGGLLRRVAHGVYLVSGAPTPDHLDLRAAWLQLAPQVPAWERTADQGVVSHRSAAAIYGIGGLRPDRHEFLMPGRRQSRRRDVLLRVGSLEDAELRLVLVACSLPVRPASHRIFSSLGPIRRRWVR